ncbi:NADH oxidase [Planctomycetes bacterium Poly30]|uniref:NADH oxidase n=2 Tax=Saltatorellus ferox TaxID=2528018 RepID=A0A518EQ04_9BACT|nr:NADH oxidase [Planctomycetes bacterium Poly30]
MSRLYSPVRVGAFTARSRTWVPAMVPWRSTEEGDATPEVIDWYGRFADGRPGVLVVEATGIRDVPSGPLLRIGHDRYVPGLRKLVEHVAERSQGQTRLLIQLIDFLRIRRRPEKASFVGRFLAVSDRHRLAAGLTESATEAEVRDALLALPHEDLLGALNPREREALEYGERERVFDMDQPHIRELPEVLPGLFADAAERAIAAGFDGVELHFAHAYTMASFLSARNVRDDGYGTTREGRVRLALEVLAAVRARVGQGATVGCRMLGDEVIEGGTRVEDAAWFAAQFAEHGMDFVSVSKGGKFEDAKQPRVGAAAYPYTGPSGHECMPTVRIDAPGPFGRNLPLSRAIRDAVRAVDPIVPVIGCGGIGTFDAAEAALVEGDCDMVAAARQSLADPDWWHKVRTGQGAEVRRCIFTNYCEGLDQKHKEVTCQLWDKAREREPSMEPEHAGRALSLDGKRSLLAPVWNR